MYLLYSCFLLCLVSVSGFLPPSSRLEPEWIEWKNKYGKEYENVESETFRRSVWTKNLKLIQQHNRGQPRYQIQMNVLADKQVDELSKGSKLYSRRNQFCDHAHQIRSTSLPTHVDWRTNGFVTPVTNQGELGGSWAFSAVGSLEGQEKNKTGKLVALSTQNLMDCCSQYVPGPILSVEEAFECIHIMKGVDTEESYPPSMGGSCKFNPATVGATVRSCVALEKGSEVMLQTAVAQVGPISVSIDASHVSFQLYESGVYYEPKCSNSTADHDVLVVGYGHDSGEDFWIVKNSWGDAWGEKGYIRMARNQQNNCGIATAALYPVV